MHARPLVRRRTAVAGAFGGLTAILLAAGCDTDDDLVPPSSEQTPVDAGTTGEQTPDEALVDQVLSDLGSALGTLASVRSFRTLRKPLAPLVRAHRAHVSVLEGEVESGTGTTTHANAAAALLAVHASERALQAALVDAAVRAESGALARLLASMSASVSQHLATLPREAAA